MSDIGFTHRYVPPRGNSSRTLLLLHRSGGNENDLLTLGEELAPEAGLLSPLLPEFESGVRRSDRRGSDGGLDRTLLLGHADELAEFLEAASVEYGFDAGNVVAVGYLNGANRASTLLMRHPCMLAGAVLLHGTAPFPAGTLADLSGKRVFIGAGMNDAVVSRDETRRLAKILSDAGAEVATAWFQTGHYLSDCEVREASLWLESLLDIVQPLTWPVGSGLVGLLHPNQPRRLRIPMQSGYVK